MTDDAPSLTIDRRPDGAAAVALRGQWTAQQLGQRRVWRSVRRALRAAPAEATWDVRGAPALDHLGALLLWQHWGRRWPQAVQTSDAQHAVLERVTDAPAQAAAPRRTSLAAQFDALGAGVLAALAQLRDFIALLGQLALDGLAVLLVPRKMPWRDFSGSLFRIGAQALPITALVGFLIGVVLAYLMSQVLRQFGAETFIVNILGLALVRELGPLLGAVLVAGRSGSSITAQIGVMRVSLVLPRALALGIAMPLIAVWTTLAALLGGMIAADLTLGITSGYFLQELPKAVPVANLWLACGKAAAFGVAIALIGCHYGLRVKPNTESLGQGTTSSVVTAITTVILIDALFAVLFKSVGLGI